MTTYGITATGFVPKTRDVIKAELEADLRQTFGAGFDLSADSPEGQWVGLLVGWFGDLWDLDQAVYASQYPDSAGGAQLVDVCALTGTIPRAATPSTGKVTLIGTNNTLCPASRVLQVVGGTSQFTTDQDVTIVTLPAWAQTTLYAQGALTQNGGNVYVQLTAPSGTSSNMGAGPAGTGLAIVDNTCAWRYLGAGTAAVDVGCTATVTGPTAAAAGALTTIITPVAGLASATNSLDITLGVAVETDALLRGRREQELRSAGTGPVDAIRARLLKTVAGITSAFVYSNVGDVTDGGGRPPHSVEALVLGGDDQATLNALFAATDAGIATYGVSVTGTVTDAQGFIHTVKLSRPTLRQIWVIVNLTKSIDAAHPYGGDAAVAQALVDLSLGRLTAENLGAGYQIGDPVVQSKLFAPIFDQVAGVVDVTKLWIGFANPPVAGANLILGARELAVFDVSRITVVSV